MLQFELTEHGQKHHVPLEYIVGYIPYGVSEQSDTPLIEQFNRAYAHGGGWRPFNGFEYDPKDNSLQYPGDPKLKPLAHAQFKDQHIYVYESAWVCVVDPDGTHHVCRMD